MNRELGLLAVGLVLGGLAGFVFAAGNGITLDGHDHSKDHRMAHGAHSAHGDHETAHATPLALPDGPEAPSLDVALTADPLSGWNLHIKVSNFRFSPENAGSSHVPGEGHAHVYVNGDKIARQYAPWLHIPDLPSGENVLAVTLNANDHRPLSVGATALRVERIVMVD